MSLSDDLRSRKTVHLYLTLFTAVTVKSPRTAFSVYGTQPEADSRGAVPRELIRVFTWGWRWRAPVQ